MENTYIGMRLDGRYEITELIGEGGMADVYRATDVLDNNRTVAVKILKKEYSENEDFQRRFRNESKAIAVLSHPNIVKIYDMGFSEKVQYIIMEYVDGITLKDYMESEKILNWKDAVHFVIQILRALQHAHDHGIVHRDIKPQNIMLLMDGTIKVMDFGIAKFAREESRTATDQAIGTVHYISPEQARGDTVDARGDLYSVGVMFYEMLTGRKPFDTDNPVSIAVMHMQNVPERPSSINPNIPPGLEEIIMHAMEKDPNRRYQSAADMIRDIEAFKQNQQIVFGYYAPPQQPEPSPMDYAKTQYIPTPREDSGNPTYNEDDYYDEPAEYNNKRKSLLVPILIAVTVVVVIVAAVIICLNVLNGTSTDQDNSSMETIPNVIGMDYDEAVAEYPYIVFDVQEQEYTEDYEINIIYRQSLEAGTMQKKNDNGKIELAIAVSRGIQKVTVPDLTNYTYEDAREALESLGLTVEEKKTESTSEENITENHIIKTIPEANTEVQIGSVVTVYVSMGITLDETDVPDFVDMTLEEAEKECEARGLVLTTEEANSSEDEGIVIDQDLEAGSTVVKGAEIHLTISNGIVPEGDVLYQIQGLPSSMTGTYTLSFSTSDGTVLSSTNFVAETLTDGSVTATVRGTGTETITVSIYSQSTGKTAVMGTYTFDFENESFTAISESLSSAIDTVISKDAQPAQVTTAAAEGGE